MAMTWVEFSAEFGNQSPAPAIIEVLKQTSVIMPRLPIKKMDGLVEKKGVCQYDGGIALRAINSAFPDTANSKVMQTNERVMIAGGQVRTDVRLESGSGGAARGTEIARRTRAASRYVDAHILNGAGLTEQKDIVGLASRAESSQLIEMATNGAVLTLDKFHELIDAVEDQGAGRFVVASRKVIRLLKKVIIAAAGGATVTDVGNEIFKYEGVDIAPIGRDHEGSLLLDFTETQGNSNVTASIYCLAPGTSIDETGAQLLMASNSIEVIPEGIRDSQHVDTLEVAVGIGLYHPRCMARLKGIKAA